MTPNIKVKLDEAFCKKKGCKRYRRHRHHKGHEFLFVPRWENSKDPKKVRWLKLYWMFREKDTVDLCAEHHAEIHLHYDGAIMRHNRTLGKPLDLYTYKEALSLKKLLIKICGEWLEKETPGVDPKRIFGRLRTKSQRRAARRKKDGGEKKDRSDH